MRTYGIDSYGRVFRQTMPVIDYSEDNANLRATLEYIEDDGIKRLLLENEKLRDKLQEKSQQNRLLYSNARFERFKHQQEKEELIKWLESEDEKLWATATDGHRFIKNISLIERRTTLREILSKLKESDKQ